MLNCHGLVIISSEIKSNQQFNYISSIKFWIASDVGNSKIQKFLLDLTVPNKELEIIKSKIQIGKVCEIVHADIIEIVPKTEYPNRFTTNICLRCKSENFKFLSSPIYYEKFIKEDINV